MSKTPRTVTVDLSAGFIAVKNVSTSPYIAYTDDGKGIIGEAVIHDCIFHLPQAVDTTNMNKTTLKLLSDSLRQTADPLVIKAQTLIRSGGLSALQDNLRQEFEIEALNNGRSKGAKALPNALKFVASSESLDDLEQIESAASARIKALKTAKS